jgi:hypothetical protein
MLRLFDGMQDIILYQNCPLVTFTAYSCYLCKGFPHIEFSHQEVLAKNNKVFCYCAAASINSSRSVPCETIYTLRKGCVMLIHYGDISAYCYTNCNVHYNVLCVYTL